MAKISKYLKLDKNVLLEYVYNDGNLIGEKYKILTDSRNKKRSYIATDTSGTGNTQINQLFNLDLVSSKYGKVDPSYYSYLQYSDYSSGTPVRHDTLKFHIPTNWTFGEHLGFYVKVYTYDTYNQITFDLSNFYFDMTNINQQGLLNYTTPPLLFQEKLWGKTISIQIPAISEVAAQLANGSVKLNSLNYNLTNGVGLSSTSPIFIDFFFVSGIQTVNNITTYTLGQKLTTSLPQTPEFEKLGLKVEHSQNGDFFEIYGTYNDNIAEFNKFINDSVRIGHKYYVQYDITMYEQNVRGKTSRMTITDNFNETIEYRPIIKYSTTTAILDVEMRLIDSVDDSYIMRRASYGMLQDEVSKYSSSLTKINLSNAIKPKIYNIKNNIDASLLGKTNSMGRSTVPTGKTGTGFKVGIATSKGAASPQMNNGSLIDPNAPQTTIETVKVPYPVLVEKFNVIGKSDNELINKNLFYGNGKMQIQIYPFDNIIKFIIATGDNTTPNYMDMSGLGEIKLTFKNDLTTIDFGLMQEANDIDLKVGQVVFKIPQSKFQAVKKIFTSGVNLFYITATNQSSTTLVYTGLFQIFDTTGNVANLNQSANSAGGGGNSGINKDPNLPQATAVVTKKLVTAQTTPIKKTP
jgi:hypothetical protein